MAKRRILVHVLTVTSANAITSASSEPLPKSCTLESVHISTTITSPTVAQLGQVAVRNGQRDIFAQPVADSNAGAFAAQPLPVHQPLLAQRLSSEFSDNGTAPAYPYTVSVAFNISVNE